MKTTWLILGTVNIVAMIGNLLLYAWGNHHPSNLGVGVLCGFAMLLADRHIMDRSSNKGQS